MWSRVRSPRWVIKTFFTILIHGDPAGDCGDDDHDVEHDWRSWQRVGLIILRSWVRSPHCAQDKNHGTIGAAGSASVLCTGGPGFDPLIVHPHHNHARRRVSLVGQDSWLSPGRHGFDSRTRYGDHFTIYQKGC